MQARIAQSADAEEIVRLASVMFDSMGVIPPPTWEVEALESLRHRLGRKVASFAVDHPNVGDRLVAAATGTLDQRLPGPFLPSGRVGYVQWVCTDTAFRRQGLGRSVMTALLGWYDAQNVASVELHSTPIGEPLYRSLGFDDSVHRALRRRHV